MNVYLLESVHRDGDDHLVWTFVVHDDISGAPDSAHVIGGSRRWQVTTGMSAPLVVHDMHAPRAPDVEPNPALAQALKLRAHEEIVRVELACLLATSQRRTKVPA